MVNNKKYIDKGKKRDKIKTIKYTKTCKKAIKSRKEERENIVIKSWFTNNFNVL